MSSDVRKIIDPGAPYSRTLKQYSIDEKLVIISHAKEHGNRAAGREYNVAESSIREWRKNEIKLMQNKKQAASGLSSSPQPTHPNPQPSNLMNKNRIINNNNITLNKNGTVIRNNGIFGMSNENMGGVGIPRREDLMKLQLVQLAMMDFNQLAQLAPLLQLQQQQRQLQAMTSQQNIPESTSTSSSVAGTPSSISSSSSTPPPSPVQSGSGRRKPRCPQKIVTSSEESS